MNEFLKELLNHRGKFVSAKTQTKFTDWLIKLNNYMSKIKFTFHTQYSFGRFFSIKAKKTYKTKYTSSSFTVSESKRLTNL